MIERLVIQSVYEWLDRHRLSLLRAATAGAILLASYYLARRPSPLYLGAVIGLGGVLILMRWPVIGLMGIVAGGLIVPVGLGTGSESEINPPMLLIVALIALWLFELVRRRQARLIRSRTTLPLIVFMVVAVLAFGMGQLPWFNAPGAPIRAQIGGLALFLLSAGAFLVTVHYVTDIRWLRRLVWVFMALGGVYIAACFLTPLQGLTNKLYLPAATGSLFWTWLVSLAFSQAAFNRQLHRNARLALFALAVATMAYSMTHSLAWTSGWAPAIAALLVILFLGAPRLGVAAACAGVLGLALAPRVLSGLLDVGDNSYSAMTRVEAWDILFQIIKVSPILGLGPSNYYFYTPLFSILGYHVRFNSHNNYVDLLAQTGVLGLASFAWFFLEAAGVGWRLWQRLPPGFARAYALGTLGGLAGTLVAGMLGDWIVPFVYNIGFGGFRASVLAWVFMGGLVALEQMAASPAASK